jgi:hypothetical protein
MEFRLSILRQMHATPVLAATTRRRLLQHVFASWQEAALFVICAAIVTVQVFIPPYIGLADNGDFPKVAARFSLRATDPGARFDYFNADYLESSRFHWVSDVQSSELWPATLAVYLSGAQKEGGIFNIRWLGAIHTGLFLAAFYLMLVALRPLAAWARIGIGAAAIWMFTDVSYVSYFNSFYSDTPALLGLLGATAIAVLISMKGWRTSLLLALFGFSVFWIGSKPQHAPWGFLPAAFVLTAGWREKRTSRRVAAIAVSALLIAAMAVTIGLTPRDYGGQGLFNLIFGKLTVRSSTPERDLEELGLSKDELRYVGLYIFHPQTPTNDPKWFDSFRRRTNYSKLARFYLSRPGRAFDFLDFDLHLWANHIRANVANLRRQDAKRPVELTTRFASWSDLRSILFRRWPYHIVAWYALLGAGIFLVLRARPSRAATWIAWIAAGLAAAAIGEYCVSSLADSCETGRHLFLFHTLTDLTVLMAVAAALSGTLGASFRGLRRGAPAL